MFTRYALIANSVPAADEAVALSPSAPEAHRARATVLNRLQKPAEAATSLEIASGLRYRDDYLWIELGNTREELGNTESALAALDQAVHWAPYYAHTHWQRGNLLLRMGRTSDAFAELRKAAEANSTYAPNLIDLAWGISKADIQTTESLLNINDDTKRLALIRFLARKGKGSEVVDQIRSLTTPLSTENRTELARLLFAGGSFAEAATLANMAEASILNGRFEEPLVVNESGFGWIIAPELKSRLAIDVSEKLGGARSLQINLDGTWAPETTLLSQTFIVKPGIDYRLSFGVSTKDLVTGGPPVLTVVDAKNNRLLGKPVNFPTGTTPWVRHGVEFMATTPAVVVRLQRSNCDSSPCPIFGTLWLDEFYIEQTPGPVDR